MKTTQLYYDDNSLLEFSGRILTIEKLRKPKENKNDTASKGDFRLLLDRTAFYPEGGGQPEDRGEISGCPVVHVKKEDGEIWHYIKDPNGRTEETLTEGSIIYGSIDGEHRFDYQQQHTGQHILSAVFMELGNYATVSVHQGEEYTTIEFQAPEIDPDFLARAEERANEVICLNRPIRLHWTDEEGLADFTLRRPSKQKENIRIVEVDGVDQVACGGLHLETTGQTGLIKLIGTEKIRGNTRTVWKIGRRAMEDYRLKTGITEDLTSLLSVPPEKIGEAVRRVLEESAAKDAAVKAAGVKLARLEAARIFNEGNLAVGDEPSEGKGTGGSRMRTAVFEALDGEVFRNIALALADYEGIRFCLLNRREDALGWIIGHGKGEELDFNEIRNTLLTPLGARGGGRPPIWQGGGLPPEKDVTFLEAWKKLN